MFQQQRQALMHACNMMGEAKQVAGNVSTGQLSRWKGYFTRLSKAINIFKVYPSIGVSCKIVCGLFGR